MAIAFVHFTANLLIALILLRLIQFQLVARFGPDNPMAKALAFAL